MDKLYAIKIRQSDGTYGAAIPVSVLAENVDWNSTLSLVDILGQVDTSASIQDQINSLKNTRATQASVNALDQKVDNAVEYMMHNSQIADAREGVDGTEYNSLKERLDTEYNILQSEGGQSVIMVNEEPVSATKMVVETGGDAIELALQSDVDSAIAAEVSARNAAIASEASTRQITDNSLQSQINQLVAPSGAAPSAAEVQNARVGYDGKTYDTLGNAIREQVKNANDAINLINKLFEYAEIIEPTSTYSDSLYNYTSNNMQEIRGCTVKRVNIDSSILAYFVTTSSYAGSAYYPLISYFDSSNTQLGYEYLKTGTVSISNQRLNIPANASYFYVNSRDYTSVIYTLDSSHMTVADIEAAIKTHEKSLNAIINSIDIGNIIDAERLPGYGMYSISTHDVVSISHATVKKVNISSSSDIYLVTSSVYAGDAVFPIIIYFDSSDTEIGYEYLNSSGGTSSTPIKIENTMLNIPQNAAYFYVNARNFHSIIKKVSNTSTGNKTKKSISILFIGNSMTQDAIGYVPYILRHYYPSVDFNFYVWYVGGKTLADHYQYFTNGTVCEIFSVSQNNSQWENYLSSYTIDTILQQYKFDIVCLQEYFNYKETYTNVTDWDNCRNYIISHYTGGNGLEFISLLHAPRTNGFPTTWDMVYNGNALILQQTIADDMIPAGIAKYRALSTSIGTLGDGGDLTPGDRTHAQEGIPALLQSFTVVCWILNKLSVAESIYGCPLRITDSIYQSMDVPGPNLGNGVITGTDAENLIAQEVAIKACKEGRTFVNKNIYIEPTP